MSKTFAVIKDGRVANIVLADKPMAENWVLSSKAAIGDEYANGRFTKPQVSEKEVKKDRISLLIDALVSSGVLTEEQADKINQA